MEDDLDYGKDMTLEELEKLEEIDIEFDKDVAYIKEGVCPNCNEEFIKVVEDSDVLGGDVTFHITKLRCPKCDKKYLDLNNAEKYDLLLMLKKVFKQPIGALSKKVAGLV